MHSFWNLDLDHRSYYATVIGVGRLRILGGGGGGEARGPNSQQAHDVVTTSMRYNDVASTSFQRHVPTRFLINQCQIITFLYGGPKGMLVPPTQIIGGGPPPPSSYAYDSCL